MAEKLRISGRLIGKVKFKELKKLITHLEDYMQPAHPSKDICRQVREFAL